MLSSQLKELESFGYISRKAYAVVPPRVEYAITEKGKKVIPVIEVIAGYGKQMMKEKQVVYTATKK
jgi:DNA-binding HxlR family transcriptional regulator